MKYYQYKEHSQHHCPSKISHGCTGAAITLLALLVLTSQDTALGLCRHLQAGRIALSIDGGPRASWV